ncbi:periplasmic divalent cation tolerance protein [Herbihabitans rhizosphaerae]|uniref:Periplasmic divalent cation tolerance protein n=1 Tax=Herbihabitans rhizosphaerae TaxID=1872711 RepID=A0A4Q7KWJ6_9PSEU|nr:divalent-cation tolerance protein CutA [Herbihabitans rhizosphaerae]RZS41037.1 periplasmic divalent cation tolerance protein [Herbihabitans rhizosphaerae]
MIESCVQVITTIDSEQAARDLVAGLVQARLAACVQIVGPVTSVYRWDGAIQTDTEWQCVIKTSTLRLDELTEYVKAHHPYDVPEVIATPITGGSPQYLAWIGSETRDA